MANVRDLHHLIYRCTSCKRILTKYQLIKAWDAAEAAGDEQKGACVCGGARISPTNVTLFEELTRPSIWKVWWLDVVLPRLRK